MCFPLRGLEKYLVPPPLSTQPAGTVSIRLLVLLGLCFATGACRRTDPLDRPVSAHTPQALSLWRMGNDLSTENWRKFDLAVQEIKLDISANHEATGSEAIDEKLCERIDRQTVRQVILRGYRKKIERLIGMQGELEHFVAVNSTLQARPGDIDNAMGLRNLIERQTNRLAATKEEIAALKADLNSLEPVAAPAR